MILYGQHPRSEGFTNACSYETSCGLVRPASTLFREPVLRVQPFRRREPRRTMISSAIVRTLSFLALASAAFALVTSPTDFGHNNATAAVTRDSANPPASDSVSDNSYGGDGDGTGAGRYPNTWVAKLFYETLVDFTVLKDVGSTACQRQTQMFIRHLANDSLWAVQSE